MNTIHKSISITRFALLAPGVAPHSAVAELGVGVPPRGTYLRVMLSNARTPTERKKRLVGLLVAAGMFACIPHAFALSAGFTVTKATQVEQGLGFTLSAIRTSEAAVLVRMEIPREGKLKDLKSVKMRIGAEPLVWADLETTTGKNGALVVAFQLAPNLADKCSIDLMTTSLDGVYFSVELKGYITDKK